MKFGLYYDLRNPNSARRSYQQFYSQVLEQVAYAEQLGFHQAWLSEHHFCADGYTPSPMIWSAAIGAATAKLRVGTNLIVLPLHDPVRVAEDAAAVSLLTGGRFDLGVGGGYRAQEFHVFNRNIRHRPSLVEEGIAVIRAAWAESEFSFEGKRHHYENLQVVPAPETPPALLMGGTSAPSIARAARVADGFLATFDDHIPLYIDALVEAGKDPAAGRVVAGKWALIAEDPEREWARVGDQILYQINDYIAAGSGGGIEPFTSPQQVLDNNLYVLWDGATAVREIVAMARRHPQIEQFKTWTLMPGEDVDRATARLEYLAGAVIPEVTRQLAPIPIS